MTETVTDPNMISLLNSMSAGQRGPVGQRSVDPEDLTGEEYLNHPDNEFSSEDKAAIRAISKYKLPASGRNMQQYFPYAAQYDPNFDYTNYTPNIRMRTSFKSGADRDNIKIYETLINHATGLDNAIDRMHNSTVAPHLLNSISQSIKYNAGNEQFQGAMADFDTHKTGVATELAKAFRNAGMAESDIDRWRSRISETDSPVALHQSVRSAMDLLSGRMQATLNKWNQAFPDEQMTVQSMLGQEARSGFNRLMSGGLMGNTQGPAQAAPGPQSGLYSGTSGAQTVPPMSQPGQTGGTSGAQSAPPMSQPTPRYHEGQTAVSRSGGPRLIFKQGQWVPAQ
jgi:hypothetical protein